MVNDTHGKARPLIGLSGHKGAGKDSVAAILAIHYGYRRVAFADALKLEVWKHSVQILGHVPLDGHTLTLPAFLAYIEAHKHDDPSLPTAWPRQLLQAWGTMRRDLCGDDYWINTVQLWPGVVVTDVRFANEALAISRHGGHLWRVVRPGYDGDSHISESEMDRHGWMARWTIHNSGTLDDLERVVCDLMADYDTAYETAVGG